MGYHPGDPALFEERDAPRKEPMFRARKAARLRKCFGVASRIRRAGPLQPRTKAEPVWFLEFVLWVLRSEGGTTATPVLPVKGVFYVLYC